MRLFIATMFVLAFLGCNTNQKPQKPKNLISKDVMVNVLHDIYIINLANGHLRNILVNSGFDTSQYLKEKYNVDSTQFVLSNNYYAHNSEEYNEIIQLLKEKLSKEQELFQLENQNEMKRKLDSKNETTNNSNSINEFEIDDSVLEELEDFQ